MTEPRPAAPSTPSGERYFDSSVLAELFDRYTGLLDEVDNRFTTWILANLPDDGGKTAVDLGCGAGRHSVLLAERYPRVLAVDVAEQMLRIARSTRPHPAITYARRSVLEMTADTDGRSDLVFSAFALHHVGDPDDVLPHARSLLAPGGTLIVADIVDPGGWSTGEFHIDRAFGEARRIYQRTGRAEDAADVLRLLLNPQWLDMAGSDPPLPHGRLHRQYSRHLPGVQFTDDLHPLICGAVWHAPHTSGGGAWS